MIIMLAASIAQATEKQKATVDTVKLEFLAKEHKSNIELLKEMQDRIRQGDFFNDHKNSSLSKRSFMDRLYVGIKRSELLQMQVYALISIEQVSSGKKLQKEADGICKVVVKYREATALMFHLTKNHELCYRVNPYHVNSKDRSTIKACEEMLDMLIQNLETASPKSMEEINRYINEKRKIKRGETN